MLAGPHLVLEIVPEGIQLGHFSPNLDAIPVHQAQDSGGIMLGSCLAKERLPLNGEGSNLIGQ